MGTTMIRNVDAYTIFYSYGKPVAFRNNVTGNYFRTEKFWTNLVSEQIEKWLLGKFAMFVPQSAIDSLSKIGGVK